MLGRAEPMLVWLVLLLPPLLSVVPAVDSEAGTEAEPGTGPLTRRKRYVVFPEGSSFSIALCMTVHTLTPDNIFTEGLNWGISYDLPNESKPELAPLLRPRDDAPGYGAAEPGQWDAHGKYYLMPGAKKYYRADHHYLQRRHRRDLYGKLEVVIDAMGFHGRSCVLRALCEASQRFVPRGNSLLEEMMRIVFTLPLKKLFPSEPPEHHTYAEAHRAGQRGDDCLGMFPRCSFSLIDMALGKYSVPDDFDAARPLPLDLTFAMK
ncbi:uncharacterized protein LOC131664956 isoform X1 [Phymastichus coffea]|uniref:uncharacterized protein LOC131664956 isoform X1 n=1 Tax=Phymastichus coffea TaxID=108790 RepID=UPI00273C7EDF|nr:uncharacterized protein LOC131664956 isoform X1 [Phymastichus coffea]